MRGGKQGELKVVDTEQMQKLLQKKPQGLIAHIYALQVENSKDISNLEVEKLLSQFEAVFQEPKELPPSRTHDHHIPLKPGEEPPNIRPYRYPYFQKIEIESQVKSMLQSGVIQPSVSPFSAPVLLVKKKDAT